MKWAAPDRGARAAFDDAAEIHHQNVVAEIGDHRQVMGDEEIGDAKSALHVH